MARWLMPRSSRPTWIGAFFETEFVVRMATPYRKGQVLTLSFCGRVEQDGPFTLAKLRKLKYLFISNKYKFEDVAALAGARPDLECDLFEPVSGVYDFLLVKNVASTQ
ncbi:hypothetical protein ULG90_01910 [Halopseudomonas pachastrellae]|nr:hypothetical protein ULG90_01910 [Halopseudomonas pachastrellae]